ncbi:fibronectin type III domain-containing protein [Phthorimaea operculella]|nr:fibronectin type III domain-containing protein [Phthorimaea operculella]
MWTLSKNVSSHPVQRQARLCKYLLTIVPLDLLIYTLRSYRFRLEGEGEAPRTVTRPANSTGQQVAFRELVPGRLYNVTMWTLSKNVSSHPVQRQARLYLFTLFISSGWPYFMSILPCQLYWATSGVQGTSAWKTIQRHNVDAVQERQQQRILYSHWRVSSHPVQRQARLCQYLLSEFYFCLSKSSTMSISPCQLHWAASGLQGTGAGKIIQRHHVDSVQEYFLAFFQNYPLSRYCSANSTGQQVAFRELVPGRLYNVTMWTVSKNVSSHPVQRQARLFPRPITELKATEIGAREISLSWDKPVGDYTDFELQYLTAADSLANRSTKATHITITGLRPHTLYTFTVEGNEILGSHSTLDILKNAALACPILHLISSWWSKSDVKYRPRYLNFLTPSMLFPRSFRFGVGISGTPDPWLMNQQKQPIPNAEQLLLRNHYHL